MKRYSKTKLALITTAVVAMATLGANAQMYMYTYDATGNPGGGNPQSSAQATFTYDDSAHTLTIVVENLETGNGYSSQAISGLSFMDGLTGTTTYEGGTGATVQINQDGTYAVTPATQDNLTHWDFGGSPTLSTLTGAKPNEMIIAGPGGSVYDLNGNGKGFSGFDPYVYLSATFVLSNANITASSTFNVSDVSFTFGTPDGSLDGTRVPNAPIPEASTVAAGLLMLLPLGIGTIRALRRERSPVKIS